MSGWDLLKKRIQLDLADAADRTFDRVKGKLEKIDDKLRNSPHVRKHLFEGTRRTKTSASETSRAARTIIGTLKLRVKHLETKSEKGRMYFNILHENEVIRSPTAFHSNGGFEWELSASLPVTDITSVVTVVLYSSKLLSVDSIVGAVKIPFFRFLRDQNDATKAELVFQVYPIKRGGAGPGQRKVSGTGFKKNKFDPENLLHVSMEFHGDQLPWVYYFENVPIAHPIARDDDALSSTMFGEGKELLKVTTDIKKNVQRLENGFLRVLNNPGVLLIMHVRSGENWVHASCSCIAVVLVSRILPVWFIMAFYVVLCSYWSWPPYWNNSWVVFNEDITDDPEKDLNQIQKVAKVAGIIADINSKVEMAASTFEKVLNAFDFSADPIVASLSLQILFIVSLLAVSVIHLLTMIDIPIQSIVAFLILVPLPRIPDTGVPRKIVNFLNRIPNDDDLGILWLAKQQAHVHIPAELSDSDIYESN